MAGPRHGWRCQGWPRAESGTAKAPVAPPRRVPRCPNARVWKAVAKPRTVSPRFIGLCLAMGLCGAGSRGVLWTSLRRVRPPGRPICVKAIFGDRLRFAIADFAPLQHTKCGCYQPYYPNCHFLVLYIVVLYGLSVGPQTCRSAIPLERLVYGVVAVAHVDADARVTGPR